MKPVLAVSKFDSMKMYSRIDFVMPITLTSLQALSVDMPTTSPTDVPESEIARTKFSGPMTFVITAPSGKYSHVGACLSAAA